MRYPFRQALGDIGRECGDARQQVCGRRQRWARYRGHSDGAPCEAASPSVSFRDGSDSLGCVCCDERVEARLMLVGRAREGDESVSRSTLPCLMRKPDWGHGIGLAVARSRYALADVINLTIVQMQRWLGVAGKAAHAGVV